MWATQGRRPVRGRRRGRISVVAFNFCLSKNVQSARPSFEKFQLTSLILILRLRFNKYVDAMVEIMCWGCSLCMYGGGIVGMVPYHHKVDARNPLSATYAGFVVTARIATVGWS